MTPTPARRDIVAPPQGLRIVLIDDSWWNHSPQAVAGLKGHSVTYFQDVEAAHRYLNRQGANDVDVLLVDLWMPTLAPRDDVQYRTDATDRHAGLDIPSGLAFAVRVSNFGVPVAICTDGHHHSDRLVRLAHQSTVTPVYGAGMVLIFEAFHFSVPSIRFVEKYNRIFRVKDMPGQTRKRMGKGRYLLYELEDTNYKRCVGDVARSKTRPVKDWGAVLEARLRMALHPPGYKTNPRIAEQ